MTSEEQQQFLKVPRTAVLATLDAEGWPHLSGMWFLPGPVIRMWTYAKSQKAVNARRDARGSLVVEHGVRYSELMGVSMRGRLTVIDDFEEVRAIGVDLYRRYTQPELGLDVEEGPITEIERQARKRVGLLLDVEDVASWDHSKLS